MTDRIRELRRSRGWTQAQLASVSGLSRALVAAVETGRQSPAVHAALALAQALDTTVEDLFGHPGGLPVIATDLSPGTVVDGAMVGDRLVALPRPWGHDGSEAWTGADAVVGETGWTWLPGARPADIVLAGCDPVLGLLAAEAGRSGRRVLVDTCSTGRAIDALADGRAHGAIVHDRPGELPEPPVPVARWHVAEWTVGLGSVTSTSLDELISTGAAIAQRDTGAGAQHALERALADLGATSDLSGPLATGHLDAARRVAHREAVAGVMTEAAAAAQDLRFTSLETHAVELWVDRRWLDLTAVTAVIAALTSSALISRARLLAGYDLTRCGTSADGPDSPGDSR